MPLDIREIPLGDHMTKYSIQMPGLPAIHWMKAPQLGRPHDHPFGMTSVISFGGYREEVFNMDGTSYFIDHRRDDSKADLHQPVNETFYIPARRIHRIVELFEGECCTHTWPHKWEQEWGEWEFREDGAYKRTWINGIGFGDFIKQEQEILP